MYLGNESEKADPTFLKPTYDYDDEVDRQFGLHSRTQITILHVDGRRFPVYWIHYVCWRAYVTHGGALRPTDPRDNRPYGGDMAPPRRRYPLGNLLLGLN
jgi:hypothetical protein